MRRSPCGLCLQFSSMDPQDLRQGYPLFLGRQRLDRAERHRKPELERIRNSYTKSRESRENISENKYGVEGDTPSFLHVTPNGLNDPTVCSQAGWGGYFRWGLSPDSLTTCYTNADPAVRCISEKYENTSIPQYSPTSWHVWIGLHTAKETVTR